MAGAWPRAAGVQAVSGPRRAGSGGAPHRGPGRRGVEGAHRCHRADALVPPSGHGVAGTGRVIHMAWDETYDADSRIESGNQATTCGSGSPPPSVLLATDYYLASDKGRTVLRVVTSGFGGGTDGTIGTPVWGRAGTSSFAAQALPQHHRERTASSPPPAPVPRRSDGPGRAGGSGGWLARTGFTGTELLRTPTLLVMTVPRYNNAILRVELDRSASTPLCGSRLGAWSHRPWRGSPARGPSRSAPHWNSPY
jgi:hypothetical protein